MSPSGCLQFSLRLRVSLTQMPAARLLFVQYLFALAVTEACRDGGMLGPWGDRVRIKWPNDLYIVVDGGTDHITKVAGILVYTSFDGDDVDIIIGECHFSVVNNTLLTPAKHRLRLKRTEPAAYRVSCESCAFLGGTLSQHGAYNGYSHG